jgi:hypothetical protein
MAVATALLFCASPIWWVPDNRYLALHERGWQLVAGNSFFFAMCGFLVGVAAMLASRHVTARRTTVQVADSRREPEMALGGSPP